MRTLALAAVLLSLIGCGSSLLPASTPTSSARWHAQTHSRFHVTGSRYANQMNGDGGEGQYFPKGAVCC